MSCEGRSEQCPQRSSSEGRRRFGAFPTGRLFRWSSRARPPRSRTPSVVRPSQHAPSTWLSSSSRRRWTGVSLRASSSVPKHVGGRARRRRLGGSLRERRRSTSRISPRWARSSRSSRALAHRRYKGRSGELISRTTRTAPRDNLRHATRTAGRLRTRTRSGCGSAVCRGLPSPG